MLLLIVGAHSVQISRRTQLICHVVGRDEAIRRPLLILRKDEAAVSVDRSPLSINFAHVGGQACSVVHDVGGRYVAARRSKDSHSLAVHNIEGSAILGSESATLRVAWI